MGTMKRTLDIIIAAVALVVLFPLLAIVALLIVLQDGHSPIFRQERCGRGLSRFLIVKVRTMTSGRHGIADYIEDARVTRVGRVLRQVHLDEALDLWNVLAGDMSIVGPRPMPFSVDQSLDLGCANTYQVIGWAERNSVRPGITGRAQVFCPKRVSRRRKFTFDAIYVRRQSLLLDLWILMATVVKICGR